MPPEDQKSVTRNAKRTESRENLLAADAVLTDPVLAVIVERVIRVLYVRNPGLKKAAKKNGARTVTRVERIVPDERFSRLLEQLCTENLRAEKLLAELRQVRIGLVSGATEHQ